MIRVSNVKFETPITLENERIIIVTEDLCEIVANIDEMG